MKSIYCERILLPQGWAENRVIRVGDEGFINEIVTGRSDDAENRACGPVVPGMPNVHSHAFQRAMAGLTEVSGTSEDTFWTWRQWMYRFLKILGLEEVEIIAAQLYMEMLKSGFTSVGEFHYLHHDKNGDQFQNPAEMSERIISAAKTAGIGITFLPVLYRYNGFGNLEPQEGQKRFLNNVDGFLDLLTVLSKKNLNDQQIMLGIAPHSLRAVSPEMLAETIPAFRKIVPEGPIHMHVAEQASEVRECLNWSGKRPFEWLQSNITLGPQWCLVHATHLTDEEREGLAASGTVAGLCPSTEANLGDGMFPLCEFIEEGGSFSIGTDSHVSISVPEELRWLEYQQRLVKQKRNLLACGANRSTGAALFQKALAGGQKALGRRIGKLAPGYRADWLILEDEHPLLCGKTGNQLLDSWIFCGNVPLVRDVVVGGREVVRGGRHFREETITPLFRKTMKQLLERVEG